MRAYERASRWLLAGAVLLGSAGLARAQDTLELSGELQPGAVIYILRPARAGLVREVGRLRITRVAGEQATAELERGSSEVRPGDRLEVEASLPEEWRSFR